MAAFMASEAADFFASPTPTHEVGLVCKSGARPQEPGRRSLAQTVRVLGSLSLWPPGMDAGPNGGRDVAGMHTWVMHLMSTSTSVSENPCSPLERMSNRRVLISSSDLRLYQEAAKNKRPPAWGRRGLKEHGLFSVL